MTNFHFPIKLLKVDLICGKCQIAKRAFFGMLDVMDIPYFSVVLSGSGPALVVMGTSAVLD